MYSFFVYLTIERELERAFDVINHLRHIDRPFC